MGQKKIVLVMVLALVVLLGGAYALYANLGAALSPNQMSTQEADTDNGESGSSEEVESVPAPDFTVYDGEGNEVHLSD